MSATSKTKKCKLLSVQEELDVTIMVDPTCNFPHPPPSKKSGTTQQFCEDLTLILLMWRIG